MSIVQTAMAVSLDGFIARAAPRFRMSKPNAGFLDGGVGKLGAVVAGRRTYDVSDAWGGRGPVPGLPLFIATHHVPDSVPPGDPPYTFVTDGVEAAIAQARAAAGGNDVHLMGASVVQQAIHADLLDELVITLVPVVLGGGVRLLEDLQPLKFEAFQVIHAPGVTHLTYRVTARGWDA